VELYYSSRRTSVWMENWMENYKKKNYLDVNFELLNKIVANCN